MKKLTLALLLILSASTFLFADTGLMAETHEIKTISTEWFDIIYAEGSENSAARLYLQADAIYREICSDYGIKPNFRMPVVISPAREDYNAYYTTYPFNHIVLYDSNLTEGLSVQTDTIIDTFVHELTHAITYNHRSKFMKTVNDIFADSFNIAQYITVPTFISEGATVSQESKKGNGRINDYYYMHKSAQAKIEDNFPSYADVTGSRGTYPSKSGSYQFGGAFADYLQKTYGMEKYSAFWYNCVNLKGITYKSAFKKAYGKTLDKVWDDFRKSIPVPDTPANPLENEGIGDFFTYTADRDSAYSSTAFSKQNSSGSRYSSVQESSNGFSYLENFSYQNTGNTETTSILWFAEKNPDGTPGKFRQLFKHNDLISCNLDKTSKYAAVNYDYLNGFNIKSRIAIYSIENGSWYYHDENSLSSPVIFRNNNEYYLAATKNIAQQTTLCIYRMILSGRNSSDISELQFIKQMELPEGDTIFYLTDSGRGTVTGLYVNGYQKSETMERSIKKFSGLCSAGEEISCTSWELPLDRMNPKYINQISSDEYETVLSFSWTAPGIYPRLGFLKIDNTTDEATFMLMNEDISGGIYYSSLFSASRTDSELPYEIFYTGEFYEDKKLLLCDCSKFTFSEYDTEAINLTRQDFILPDTSAETEKILAGAKKYTPLFSHDGILEPWGIIPEINLSFNTVWSTLFPGVTYLTSNPWNSTYLQFSAAYDFLCSSLGLNAYIKHESDSDNFATVFNTSAFFDSEGFKQFYIQDTSKLVFKFGDISKIQLSEVNYFFMGRNFTSGDFLYNDLLFGSLSTKEHDEYFADYNYLIINYSNKHLAAPGFFGHAGFDLTLIYYLGFADYLDNVFTDSGTYALINNISLSGSVYFPKLLPIDCKPGYTYNLPFILNFSLYPDSYGFASAGGELILFSMEIQKGLKSVPLYFHRFNIYLDGTVTLNKQASDGFFPVKNIISDCQNISAMTIDYKLALNFMVDMGINTGGFASKSMSRQLGLSLVYDSTKTNSMFDYYFTASLQF